MGPIADLEAGGDGAVDEGVELGEVDGLFGEADHLEATADVHSDEVGHHAVADGHRRTDDAARPAVHITHDADRAVLDERAREQLLDLVDGPLVDIRGVGINDGIIVESLDGEHRPSLRCWYASSFSI